MYLKNTTFNHEEEKLHNAFLVSKELYVRCRERVFFATFLGYVLCNELYEDRDSAPRDLRTLTGDLQRTLALITDPVEYDITLINFMQYNRMALSAYAHIEHMEEQRKKNKEKETEEDLKRQIGDLVKKMIRKKLQENDKEEEDEENDALELPDMIKRLDCVKQSNSSFEKYMRLMGYTNHNEVDDLLKKALG